MTVLTKCFHPIRIKNKRTGEYMFVPCGHCPACAAAKRKSMANRLQIEMDHCISALFITLTYDNNNVPYYKLDNYDAISMSPNRLVDFNFAEAINNANLKTANLDLFLPEIQNPIDGQQNCFAACSKLDIQLFLKRLRNHITYDKLHLLKDVQSSQRSFRYFIAAEYGPKTFRPHYHGILFFRDVRVARAAKARYLSASWQYSSDKNLRAEFVTSGAARYVSKYVNSDTKLPILLQIKPLNTFHLASKNPAIGVYDGCENIVNKVLSEHSVTYNKVSHGSDGSCQSVTLPYPSQLLRYFMPDLFNKQRLSDKQLLSFLNLAYIQLKELNQDVTSWDLDFIKSSVPNLCPYVKQKFHVGSDIILDNDLQPKKVHVFMSDVEPRLSDISYIFGIPVNRMFICRALYFISLLGITPSDYINLYFRFINVIFSSSYSRQLDFYHEILLNRPYGLSVLFMLINPSFVLNLPRCISKIDSFHLSVYDNYLHDFNLDITDFYDVHGRLKSKYLHFKFSKFHTQFPDFTDFKNSLVSENLKSQKKSNISSIRYSNGDEFNDSIVCLPKVHKLLLHS